MTVEVFCIGTTGDVLGGTTVTATGERGRLLASGPVRVPILVGGAVGHIEIRIPDADWTKRCRHHFETYSVNPGDTITCTFENDILATIT